jgi:hypothetical protein
MLVRFSASTPHTTAYFAFRVVEQRKTNAALEDLLAFLSTPPISADVVVDARLVGGTRLLGVAISGDGGDYNREALREAAATLAAALEDCGVVVEVVDPIDFNVFHSLSAALGGTHG